MKNHSGSFLEFLFSAWRYRHLVISMIRRDISVRYRGSVMGIFWSFFTPLFMLAVYTFVFSVVFNARWGAQSGSKVEFSLVLFVGLIAFNFLSECINRAPTLVVSNANYVKKVVFPLEILPWICVGSAAFQAVVSVLVWLLGYFVFIGLPPLTILLLPLVVAPLIVLCIGLVYFLSSLGVYVKDVAQFSIVITSVMMFLTPIFYPVSALPESYRSVLYLNPLTSAVEALREIMYWGNAPDWGSWALSFAGSLLMAWGGFAWFQKTRKGFADVL